MLNMKSCVQFANFLEKEFSIENLLFVTEYVMLKQQMMRNDKLKLKIMDLDGIQLDIPSSIPTSLSSSEKVSDIKHHATRMKELYEKYIPYSASLTVNISSSSRSELSALFVRLETREEDLTLISDIMHVMEKAATEVTRLMNDNFYRFRRTEVFQKIVNAGTTTAT